MCLQKKYNANFREKALTIYDQILANKAAGRKMFALLIDPEKCSDEWLCQVMSTINFCNKREQNQTCLSYAEQSKNLERSEKQSAVGNQLFIFVGGSQLKDSVCTTVARIKQLTSLPVVMFPGNASQFADNANALLFLSLVSGRNAKYLIEQHIEASRAIKSSGVECISTGYILVDGGKLTAVERVSHTSPYPTDNIQLITDTALACELLGHKMVYLEAGSGAHNPVNYNIIKAVHETISIPLIVGGGIKTPEQMIAAFSAGADLVVVGNHIESHPDDLEKMIKLVLF